MPSFLLHRKVLALLATVAILFAVALWPKRQGVDLSPVERTSVVVTVEDEGETRIRSPYQVSAPVSGRLLRIELEPGDSVVARKTILATFRPGAPDPLDARTRAVARASADAAEAALGGARADRERADAALVLAAAALKRARILTAEGAASREALERAEAAARSAEEALKAAAFSVRTAEHQRDLARARLMETRTASTHETLSLTSPIDGVVLRRHRQSEALVRAGEPLLDIGNPRDLEVVSDLVSSDAVRVREGSAVRIEQWGGDGVLSARVRRVEPAGFMKISALGVEEQRVNVVMDLTSPPDTWRSLGDGYRVEVQIEVAEARNALAVPVSALFRHEGQWAVFVAEDGRSRLRKVDLGHRNAQLAEVKSGVSEGESVVDHPADTLVDGSRIKVR